MRLVAFVLWMMLASGTAAAFDCDGVTFPSTVVICSDPELMRLADERREAINDARGRIGEAAWPVLWEDQKRWVRAYAAACGVPPDRPPPSSVPALVKECFRQAGVARIAYLRGYGVASGAAPPPPTSEAATSGRVGPSFDCSKAASSLTLLICGDAQLSRVDLSFNQAYWALYEQLGPVGQPRLKEEDLAFINQVQVRCGLPSSGTLTVEARQSRDCVENAYEKMRTTWIGQLTGPAREEAVRAPEDHMRLQKDLQQLGFLAPGPLDGVYGQGTRIAIVAWQSARGQTITGFLGDANALTLEREASARSQPVVLTPSPALPIEPGNGGNRVSEPDEPSPRVATAEKPRSTAGALTLEATGTAFAINMSGQFLTNYHVIKGCKAIRLRIAAGPQDGTIAAIDERNDLAVIRAAATGIEPIRFREGKGIRPADAVVALGFPYAGLLATSPQVTTGTVSALAGMNDDSRYLQLTAPVQPGSSGGPLVDLSGNVVGIVSARINDLVVAEATGTLPQNINFAIKSTTIREFLDAHRIDYLGSPSDTKLDAADVGERAMKSTVMVECYK
jgi:S1-C subfamily serine protease/uncharacterized protein YecT (DUF1311 family)